MPMKKEKLRHYMNKKSKLKFYFPLLVIPLFISFIMFYLFNNVIVLVVYLIVTLAYVIYVNSRLYSFRNKRKNYLATLDFCRTFIFTLSVKKTLNSALEDTIPLANNKIKNELIVVESDNALETLDYLYSIFHFPILLVFIDLLKVYEDQGGEILEISFPFLQQLEQERNRIINEEYLGRKMLIQYISTWLFVFIIMAAFRVALSDLFTEMSTNIYFVGGFHLVTILFIISGELFLSIYLNKEKKREKQKAK